MVKAPDHPEPTLQTIALRYAAGDLTAPEATAFETRLADDQDARDALSEAVRLSAAALGQTPPTPHRTFRTAIRERLAGWCPGWRARRTHRGHPLVWAGVGAVAVAACVLAGLALTDREPSPTASGVAVPTTVAVTPADTPHPSIPAIALAPPPREADSFVVAIPAPATCGENPAQTRAVAELWAQMSTPEHVEKTHDEEMRWRQKLRDAGSFPTGRPPHNAASDIREP